MLAAFIDFDSTQGGAFGTTESGKPGNFYADLGVNFQTGDIPNELAVGSIVTLANPVAEFDVVRLPGTANSGSNLVGSRGGGTNDLLMSFSTPVTSVSLVTDHAIEPTDDIVRLIALESTGTPNQFRVLAVTEALDNDKHSLISLMSVDIGGAAFSHAIFQTTIQQEAIDDLIFTPVDTVGVDGGGGFGGGGSNDVGTGGGSTGGGSTGGGSTGGGSTGGGSTGGGSTGGGSTGGGSTGGGSTGSTAPPTIVSATPFGTRNRRRLVFQGVQLTFSQDVDLARALNVANYSLVEQGRRRAPRRPVNSVQYDAATNSVRVLFGGGQIRRPLRLTVEGDLSSAIVDRAGRSLDGNGDGNPGDDALFSIGRTSNGRLPVVTRL